MTIEIGGPSGGGGGGGAEIGRFEPAPVPFLTKTFRIVNDPKTDSIISWGESGDSFIIWDHIKLAVEILPNYFQHNNFSNFTRQLYNYGFRKIGVHQCEYANKDFQKGKQHLLLNMSRRRSLQHPTRQRHRRSRHCDDEDDDDDDDDDDEGRAAKREKVVVVVISDDDHEGGHVANREKEKVAVSVETASESDERKDHQNKVVKENEGDHAAKSKSADIDEYYSNDFGLEMKIDFTEILAKADAYYYFEMKLE